MRDRRWGKRLNCGVDDGHIVAVTNTPHRCADTAVIAAAVAGRGTPVGWDSAGIDAALTGLREGQSPDISGATGGLSYEPGGVDPTEGTLVHWIVRGGRFERDRHVRLADDQPDRMARPRPPPPERFVPPPEGGAFEPQTPPQRVSALIVAASSGWENFRHQADALGIYQRLRAGGLSDDDILMVGADDLASAAQNPIPGEVRNAVDGPDVRDGAIYDYGLELDADGLMGLLPADSATRAMRLDARTNLLIYLVGHGGQAGLVIGANTAAGGANAHGDVLTPTLLRENLCALRAADDARRIFVVIEACFAGVFGDAAYDGIEAGCDGEPLEGVLLIAAANTSESSYGRGYDTDLEAWISDEFSAALTAELVAPNSLSDLHRAVYLAVSGSHVSLYNAVEFGGSLDRVSTGEFFVSPGR